ncbi:MAG: succinate dehydrogenase, hydrophobic membrane anchor protein [Pseudomonadota bacterium]
MSQFRNPLQRAHHTGAAGEGIEHWWSQRFTAILLFPLVIWLVWAFIALSTADYTTASTWLSKPWNAGMAILFVATAFYHGRLGIQVVIEDYVHHRVAEVGLQVLVTVGALVGGLTAVLAILMVALGS